MFSKISQISKTFADEINRINDEVNNSISTNAGGQPQLADPEIAKKIIESKTPDISEITKPENIEEDDKKGSNEPSPPSSSSSTQASESKSTSSNSITIDTKPDDNSSKKLSDSQSQSSQLKTLDPKNFVPGTQVEISSLPQEILTKLNKYFKYEKKYPQLYEAYKIEKKKSALIRAFETMLKEQTPCSSIGELNAMRDYLNGINNQAKMLNSELTKITKEKKLSDDNILILNQKVKDLQKALTSRNAEELSELSSLKDENKRLKEENSKMLDLNQKYNLLLNKNKELQEEIKTLQASNVQNNEIEPINLENKNLKEQLDSSDLKNQQLTEKSNKLANDLNELTIKAAKEKLNMIEETEKLNQQISDLGKQLDSAKKLNDLFKERVETLSADIKNNEPTPNTKNNANVKKNSKKNKKSKKNQSTETPQNLKETEILEPETEVDSSIPSSSSSEIKMIELKHELETLNSKYQDEISNGQQLQKSLKDKDTEIEELKDMLRDVGDSLVEVQKENKSTHDLEKKLKETKNELDTRLNELEMLRLQNSNALTDYERTKTSLSIKIDDNIKKIKQLESTLTNKNSELELSRKKITDLVANNKDLESLLSKNKINEKKLKDQIALIKDEKNKLQEELESLKKSVSNDNINKTEFQNMKVQLTRKERVLVEAENKIKFLQEEKTKINDLMIELKVQNKELTNHELSFQEKNESLNKQIEKLKSEANASNLKINKLSLDNAKLIKKNEELQDQYNEVKHIKSSSNDQIESFKKRVDELLMRNKEYESRVDVLQEELTQSRNMLQERTREMTTMRKLIMDNEESQNLDRKELKSKFDRLLEEKEKSDNESLINIRNKQRELDDLKRKNSDLVGKLEELQTTKDILEDQIKSISNKTSNDSSLKVINSNNKSDNSEIDQYNSKIIESLRDSLSKTEDRLKELEDLNSKLRLVNQDSSDKLIRLNKKYKLLSLQFKRRMSQSSAPSSRNNSFVAINDPIDSKLFHPDLQNEEGKQEENEDIKEKSVYIKNVLMGYLEHKEQRQMLLPVIKMLLYMSDDDAKKLNDLLT